MPATRLPSMLASSRVTRQPVLLMRHAQLLVSREQLLPQCWVAPQILLRESSHGGFILRIDTLPPHGRGDLIKEGIHLWIIHRRQRRVLPPDPPLQLFFLW